MRGEGVVLSTDVPKSILIPKFLAKYLVVTEILLNFASAICVLMRIAIEQNKTKHTTILC